jgi:hypothetical protein
MTRARDFAADLEGMAREKKTRTGVSPQISVPGYRPPWAGTAAETRR